MSKVRNLPEITALEDTDLLYAVDDSAGPNGGRKITKANLKETIKQSAAEIKTAYESNPDTNAFDDAEKSKLAGIEPGATADQSAAEVPFDNTGTGISASNVQTAIVEVNTRAQADFIPSIVSGRILHYSGGTARFDDVFYQLVANDILLNSNITNGEVYVDLDGIVKQTASGITAPPLSIMFAKFSTDLNNIISLTDERVKNTQNLVRGILADIRDVRAGAAASAGASGRLSDAMHKHNILTGAPSTQAPDQANAEGVSANLARADHIHDIPTDAPTTSLAPSTTNSEGVGTSFARNDHEHAVQTALVGDISTIQPDATASAGVADNFARGDHRHAIVADSAVSQAPDQANAEGVSTSFARADHVHEIPTAAAIGLDSTSTNTQGAAATFARSNHTHAIASGAPSTQTPDQANAAGSSANFAKADHIHQIPTAAAVDVGAANAQGAAASFSRADHVHRGVRSVKANAGSQRFSDVSLQDGLGIAVTDDGSGNFTPDTKFGPNEFVVTSFASLTINYSGGRFVNGQNGTVTTVPAGSIVVSANVALGYLYVAVNSLSNTGTVSSSTTPPPLDSIPFAQFVSGPSAVTSTTDIRSFVNLVPLANTLRLSYSGAGLTVSYNSGGTRINGTFTAIAAGNLVLTNTIALGAIYVDPTTMVVTANTTGTFPPNCVPMATYTTSGGNVTALSHVRSFINGNIVFGASGDIVALTPDLAAAAGSMNKYADAGHVHNVPTAAASSQIPDQANAQGVAATFARADHTHNIATAAAIGLDANSTSTQGAAATFARSNHTHAIASGAASSQTPDQANAAGASANFAKADHVHNIATAAASGLNAGSTNTQGAAASFARSDHTHAIASGAASAQTPDQANAAGVSTNFARADHVHNIATAAASSLTTSSTNTQGAAASFARSDHTHAVSVSNQEATATADGTTTSATDTLMVSMTQTPAAGTYLVMWSGSIVNSANGTERTWVSLYLNGSQVSATERSIGTSGGGYSPAFTQAVITTPGAQAIELRWRVAGGTSTVHSRRLTLVRLSN